MKDWSWKSKYVLLCAVLCFTVWNKWEAVLLMTHVMDFRWCPGLTEHKDSGLSVTTAKISIWNCALSPWTLQGTWFQKQRIQVTQVTHTHCVGTNQIQTGRCLVTASSRAIALHDNSLSLLNTRKNIFPCSPYCQTPSHSRKVCPLWHLWKGSSREVSAAHPSHLFLSWQSQWAAVPAWNSPIREEKSPLIAGIQISHRDGWVMKFKWHCSDKSPHKKNFMHTEAPLEVCDFQTGAPRLRSLDILGTRTYLVIVGALRVCNTYA